MAYNPDNPYGDDPTYEGPGNTAAAQNPPASPKVPDTWGSANPWDTVKGWYKKYLGREGSQGEVDQWVYGNYGPTGEQYFQNSQEARNYQQTQSNTPKPPAAPPPPGGTGGSKSGNPGQDLLALLNGGMDRDTAIAQIRQSYGLPEGVDGSPLYYGGNNTIGLKDSYLANVGGQWNYVQRGPEGVRNDAPPPQNTQAQHDPRVDELFNTLLKRSGQSLAVDRTDPAVRSQADANAAATDRTTRNYLADLAEKAGPYANLRGETRLAQERAGQQEGSFEASLVGNEINARRAEIQNALSQMGSMLTTQQTLALQEELARLSDATNRYGIDTSNATSNSQFEQTLRQRMAEFTGTQQYNKYNDDANRELRRILGIQ
jgi:hypothetical protein